MCTNGILPLLSNEGQESSELHHICKLARQDLRTRGEDPSSVDRTESSRFASRNPLPFIRASRRVSRHEDEEQPQISISDKVVYDDIPLQNANNSVEGALKPKTTILQSQAKVEYTISGFKASSNIKIHKHSKWRSPKLSSLPHPSKLIETRRKMYTDTVDTTKQPSVDINSHLQHIKMKYHKYRSQGLQPIVSATVKRLRYDHALFDLNPSSSDESSLTTNIQESQLQEVRREIDSIADFPAVNDSRLFMSNFQDRSQNFLPKSSSSTETRNLHQIYKSLPKTHINSEDFIELTYKKEE